MRAHCVRNSDFTTRSAMEPLFREVSDSRDLTLAVRKELVLFNDRGHGHFAICTAVFDADYAPFALHADTLGERDFGRQS